jgi:hypothetical protein
MNMVTSRYKMLSCRRKPRIAYNICHAPNMRKPSQPAREVAKERAALTMIALLG